MIGIDVSHWNGDINWGIVDADFVLMKCTQGNGYFDDKYTRNKEGCVYYSIPHGVYHYFEPDIDGASQAEFFYQKAGDKYLQVWVLDVEKASSVNVANHNLNLEKAVKRLRELTGEQPWIYTSKYKWQVCTGDLVTDWAQGCQLWVAHYTTALTPLLPVGWYTWGMWQYSDNGAVAGISPVDVNRYNGTKDEMLVEFGNGQEVEPPPTTERVKITAFFLNIRSSPMVADNILGLTYKGKVWDVMGRVKADDGREWVQIAPSAYIAGWYTTPA